MPREAHEADENRWQDEQAENGSRANRIWNEVLDWMKKEKRNG